MPSDLEALDQAYIQPVGWSAEQPGKRNRTLRLELDADFAVDPPPLAPGDTVWVPLTVTSVGGSSVQLTVSSASDELMPLSPEREVRIPQAGRPVRVCAELFAVASTRRAVAVTIKATEAAMLQEVVALLEIQ